MSGIIVADRDFPRLIAGLNERAREANALINVGHDRLLIAGQPTEINFDTLTSAIREEAEWTVEKSGTVSLLKGWGRP